MPIINVKHTIPAPIGDVFDWLSTASNYAKNPMIFKSVLVEPGEDGAWGNGAVREVSTSVGWFREVISEHQPPIAFDYLIQRSRPPMNHRSGRMRFAEVPGGTEVTWRSEFEVRGPLGPMMARLGSFGFKSVLRTAERDLAR